MVDALAGIVLRMPKLAHTRVPAKSPHRKTFSPASQFLPYCRPSGMPITPECGAAHIVQLVDWMCVADA